MNRTIVARISGLAPMGGRVAVSSLQVMGKWFRAHTIGCPLQKQSCLQIVHTLVCYKGQGSMFNIPPLLGAAVDMGVFKRAPTKGAQWGGCNRQVVQYFVEYSKWLLVDGY